MKNLKAEMARFGVSNVDIQNILGCSAKTVINKLNGTTEFTMSEGFKIRDAFFADVPVEYLFDAAEFPASFDRLQAGARDSA